MSATLQGFLADAALGLQRRVSGAALRTPVSWVASSDLVDPTPFMVARQVLLTSGTQFQDADDVEIHAWVHRLAQLETVGVGFAVGVVFERSPEALVEACREHGMTLFEIPYELPFRVLIDRVADARSRDGVAAADAALSAHHRLLAAAVGDEGEVEGVIDFLASQLRCTAAVFLGSGADIVRGGSAPLRAESTLQAEHLLRRNARGHIDVALPDGQAALHSIGPRGGLLGVLILQTPRPLTGQERTLVQAALAILQVVLQHRRDRSSLSLQLHPLVADLLESDDASVAERLASRIGLRLPASPIRVVVVANAAAARVIGACSTSPSLRGRVVFVPAHDAFEMIIDGSDCDAMCDLLAALGVAAGVSAPVGYTARRHGRTQAAALRFRTSKAVNRWEDSAAARLWRLLPADSVHRDALARLAPLASRADITELLRSAQCWFDHNCRMEPAANELDIHRHTLRDRLQVIAGTLQLDLGSFADRAELWLLITAVAQPDDGGEPREPSRQIERRSTRLPDPGGC